ncbi:hypothetical protein AB1Y20_001709 [Prymnesium parvum]|uniref:Endonuclease/exonuclease/phosphatase domain-containing protein n=1 Tax=Prymnesium parvum TaxID=97485 RepID=A0AB34KC37_PRYPA
MDATILSLERFVEQTAAVEQQLSAALDEATARRLAERSDRSTVRLHEISAELADVAGRSDSVTALCGNPLFAEFATLVTIPPGLLKPDSLASLERFIRAAPKTHAKRVEQEERQAALKSEEMRGRLAAADAAVRQLVHANRVWLAASDHLPIRATLQGGGACGWSFRVVSHNVQELVSDGVNRYVSALPFLAISAEGRRRRTTLVDAILSDSVRHAQCQVVGRLIEDHLVPDGRGEPSMRCDAVCLQEVGTPMLDFLSDLCARRGLKLHASGPATTGAASAKREGACMAMTCVVSVHSFTPLRDVEVEFTTKTSTRTRRFAAVELELQSSRTERAAPPPPRLTLVSTHVMHSSESSKAGTGATASGERCGSCPVQDPPSNPLQSNALQIAQSVQAVVRSLASSSALVRGGIVLLAGDFNGRPEHGIQLLQSQTVASGHAIPQVFSQVSLNQALVEGVELCCIAHSPGVSTQLGTPAAVDGACAFRVKGLPLDLRCEVFERMPDFEGFAYKLRPIDESLGVDAPTDANAACALID